MAHYDYVEKAVTVSRREFLGIAGVAGAVLWTGAYAVTDLVKDRSKYIRMRAQGLYRDDAKAKVRQSHHNPGLQEMYKKFAGQPLSRLSEQLFHTGYVDRTRIIN